MAACGSSSPAGPSGPSPPGYTGQWNGTTSQGSPIAFTVGPDEKVTAITVAYRFNGCSGVNTFSSLSLDIGSPPILNPATPGPGFGYGSGPPDAGNYTQISGWFVSSTAANGTVIFGGYTGCGNAVAIWSANRQ
jgi:hypothetical protein